MLVFHITAKASNIAILLVTSLYLFISRTAIYMDIHFLRIPPLRMLNI